MFKDGMDKHRLLHFCRSYSQTLMLSPLISTYVLSETEFEARDRHVAFIVAIFSEGRYLSCFSEAAWAWWRGYCQIVSTVHFWKKVVSPCDLIMHLKLDLIKKYNHVFEYLHSFRDLHYCLARPAVILSSGGRQSGRIAFLLLEAVLGREKRHKRVAWCDLSVIDRMSTVKGVVRH